MFVSSCLFLLYLVLSIENENEECLSKVWYPSQSKANGFTILRRYLHPDVVYRTRCRLLQLAGVPMLVVVRLSHLEPWDSTYSDILRGNFYAKIDSRAHDSTSGRMSELFTLTTHRDIRP
ncbi:hypothetical protein OBBRIDRAFT_349839 [Obba rivulosa]|uniref:Uncharacterized protein n=1 Tax=Obba rivulosa TaxID=1052685 RepID=A0A8E2DN52_9APHY|nr:hypothetical protein OBBRIDRAFT_349839 [Obba rivulosa]